jgi:hypothetical protein
MTLLIAIAILYLLFVNPHALQDSSASVTTPGDSTLQWPPGPGQPGYVTISDQPAPAGYSLGSTGTALTAAGYAQTGVTVAGSAVAVGSLAPGASFGAIAGASSALPIVGAAVAVVGLVVGMITRHHAEMVAKEALELNQAVPMIIQRYVMIMQAAVHGDLTDLSQADQLIEQAVADYYTAVKPMLQGKWPWPFVRGGNLVPETKKPGTCNGPCIVGHYWIEPGALTCYQGVWRILHNKQGLSDVHGAQTFGPIPSHAGFNGMGQVKVYF